MIGCLSKEQSPVETSVFGAEFCTMKHSMENLCVICYKFHMMGVLIKGLSYVYDDNMPIVINVTKPESTLRKKSNLICYHAVCGAVEIGLALVADIPTKKNHSDLFPKVLYDQIRNGMFS